MLSRFVSRPKRETSSTAEDRIGAVLYLKHILNWVSDLVDIVQNLESFYGQEFAKELQQPGYQILDELISDKIRSEAQFIKGAKNANLLATEPTIMVHCKDFRFNELKGTLPIPKCRGQGRVVKKSKILKKSMDGWIKLNLSG